MSTKETAFAILAILAILAIGPVWSEARKAGIEEVEA
jgi:hypothetical protein